jgi:hypothetical protein
MLTRPGRKLDSSVTGGWIPEPMGGFSDELPEGDYLHGARISVGDAIRDEAVAGEHFFDSGDQIRRHSRFQDVAGSSRCQRCPHEIWIVMYCKEDEFCRRTPPDQSLSRFDAAHDGHGNVQNDDIRVLLIRGIQQGPAVGHAAHDFAKFAQEIGYLLNHCRMIFGK